MSGSRALAAVQTVPVAGDVAANLARHLDLAEAAAAGGARLAVFPELSLTGYELGDAERLAFSLEDERLAPLRELAFRRGLALVVGAPVRSGERLYLGALIIGGGGIDLYTKHHLGAFPPEANPDDGVPPPEASVFSPGNRDPLVRVDGDIAAVAVCADTSRPAHAAAAAARGARTYLASSFVIPADFDQDTKRLEGYAATHRMAVVFANFGGPSGGLPSAGMSTIWDPEGRIVAQVGPAGESIAFAFERDGEWVGQTVGLES